MRPRDALAMLGIAAACSGTPAPIERTRPAGTVAMPPAGSAFAAGSASSGSAAPSVAPPPLPPSPRVKVTLADAGLEASSLDRSTDPCVDFYQFACGGWLQNNQVPPDRARWTRATEVDDHTQAAIKNLLEEAAKGIGADAATRKLGDYYASCMDEAAIEKAGLAAVRPLLDRTRKVADAKTWLAAVVELHRIGRWVVWADAVRADPKDPGTNVMYLDAGELGLPDREHYVKPEWQEKLEAYKLHVTRQLAFAGIPPGRVEAAAGEVVAIETELAKLTRTADERRDLPAMYNPTDAQGLAKQVKSVDWKAYWKALEVAPGKKLVLGTPKFFAALDRLRARWKPVQWASYFTYHLVAATAFALPRAFDQEALELGKLVTGIEPPRDRSRRCIDATAGALGELLGQRYVTQYVPGSSRQAAAAMLDAIVRALHDELGKLDWMGEATRGVAQQKLGKLVRLVGFPDRWRSHDADVRRDDFAGNALRAAAFETRRRLARAGKPVDRGEWQVPAYQVDASYDAAANTATLPAGILQPPFFGPDRAVAANLGGLGTAIGRELIHGFDDQGAQLGGDGNLAAWWQKDDAARFAERRACVADMYSTFEVMPKAFVDGKLTAGESIADAGGVRIAFDAYRALRKDAASSYVADGFTEDQQFFIAVGQAWCSRDRIAETQRRLASDPHAPPKFRVYGALRNLPEFSEAFSCAPGTPMRPARTCTIW